MAHITQTRNRIRPAGFALVVLLILLAATFVNASASLKTGASNSGKVSWKDRTLQNDLLAYRLLSATNRPPSINAGETIKASTWEDTLFSIKVSAADPDANDQVTWTVSTPARVGLAAVDSQGMVAVVTYQPPPEFSGTDSFTLQASDQAGETDRVTFDIDISPANDLPLSGDIAVKGVEDAYLMFFVEDFSAAFNDPEGAGLQGMKISPVPSHGTLYIGSHRVLDGQDVLPGYLDSLTYLPDNDWYGDDSFGWSGYDGAGFSIASGLVNLDIAPSNDDPQITDDLEKPVEMDEDGRPRPFRLSLHAADADLTDTFTWSVIQPPQHGTASIAPAGIETSVQYIPELNYAGSDAFTVQVEDGSGGMAEAVVQVLVSEVKDLPTVDDSTVDAVEDRPLEFKNFDFREFFTDPVERLPLDAVRLDDLPIHGSLSINGEALLAGSEIPVRNLAKLVYTPAADFAGEDSFTWSGGAGGVWSAEPAHVSISVANQKDAPHFNAASPVTVTMSEDSSPQSFSLALEAVDPDPGDTFAWTISKAPLHGQAQISGTGLEASPIYIPLDDYAGQDEFEVTVQDSAGGTAATQVAVTVTPVNDLPVMTAFDKTIPEDSVLKFSETDFLSGFTDQDGDSLVSIKITSLPAHGALTLSGAAVKTGQEIIPAQAADLVYQPENGWSTMDYFQWTASDDSGWASPGTLAAITVTPVEDAPTLKEQPPFTMDVSLARPAGQPMLSLHAGDQDGDSLTWVLVASPSCGSLQASGEGYALFLDYVPSVACPGGDAFTIHLTDNHTPPLVIEVQVTGLPGNSAPTGANVSIQASGAEEVSFSVGSFAYSDADGNPLQSVKIVRLPENGLLYLDENASAGHSDGEQVAAGQVILAADLAILRYHFDPGKPVLAEPAFTFILSDGFLESQGYTLTVNIIPDQKKVFVPMIAR